MLVFVTWHMLSIVFVTIEVGYGLVVAHPPSYSHALNTELLKFVYLKHII